MIINHEQVLNEQMESIETSENEWKVNNGEGAEPSPFSRHLSTKHKSGRISLVWENLSLSVLTKDSFKSTMFKKVYKNKPILRSLHGKAVSGELLAIMGPTGCGKTSLMNVLAARVSGLVSADCKLTGTILVNGEPRNDAKFRRISAYVLQDDRLYPHLTVHETLMMSAHFFLPDHFSDDKKKLLVNSVIAELGLGKTRDTIIGDEKVRGVSGGERKRANIAVQLISDPAALFLDEPTSGLDSFQAQAVMESMKAMTMNGRLVITVIHQPRSSIFEMFDKLMLLSEGRCIYLGDAKLAAEHFAQVGYAAPKFFNPADYFLDILSPDSRSEELEANSEKLILKLANYWGDHHAHEVLQSVQVSNNDPIEQEVFSAVKFQRNTGLLFWRAWTEILRDKTTLFFKITLSCVFGCIIGGMYSNIGMDQSSIYNRMGLLFIIVINQSFNALGGVIYTFPKEKLIVNRERSNHAYNTLQYFIAKFFAEMPINLIPGLVFGIITYWIAGLNPDRFGIFLLILLFMIVTSITLGIAVSALSPNVETASGLGIPCVIIALIFGGFYINIDSLPPVAEWIPFISFIRWAFQAFCINEFKGVTFDCTGGSTSQCLKTGDEILESLNFDEINIERSILGLAVLFLFFLASAMIILELDRMVFLPLGHVGMKQRFQEEEKKVETVREEVNIVKEGYEE